MMKPVSMNSGLLKIVPAIVLLFSVLLADAQEKTFKASCIAFYNLENLFDTIDDPNTNDAEFLPGGSNRWTTQRYEAKLANMSKVIAGIGSEMVKGGPSIIGVSEIENRSVLEDLVKTPALKNMGLQIVHFDSPDKRGVDVGLLYNPSVFKVVNATSNRVYMPDDSTWFTRDQLVVSGELDGELISIIVNHWPSRGNGPEYREAAAKLSRALSDSVARVNKNAKIFIMGDLNDDPTDKSVARFLGAKGKKEDVGNGDLFNPFWQLHRDGIGSLAYRDSWNLFDQIIISEPLLSEAGGNWKFYKAKIYSEKFLIQKDGPYAGYPFRTFAGGAYAGGYSDHFPTYVFLIKEKN
ncbi:MAG: endonuclease/exonuclease/phosphatase family protein [Bacteroidales bacterium]|nr:endonuclease/exonuclease/phosphatase family protein [Bacteroidales bacterium]MBK9358083.1 endonuclease/exonuclease/phosphatase family protein [Bacteroidales bacterium]